MTLVPNPTTGRALALTLTVRFGPIQPGAKSPLVPEQSIPPHSPGFHTIYETAYWQQLREKKIITEVTDNAAPNIIQDLTAYRSTLTITQVNDIIKRDMANSASDVAKEDGSGVKFDLLSGKLKIDSSFKLAGAEITVGKVNLYKVSAVVAAGVAACKGLDAPEFDKCVTAALAKVGQTIMDFKSEDTFGKNDSKE